MLSARDIKLERICRSRDGVIRLVLVGDVFRPEVAGVDAALAAIERYFDKPPKPGTPAGDRFDLLARVIDDYEPKQWPIEP